MGFDPRHARKLADTIVATETGKEIIIRAPQAVLNPTTSTTLQSENRFRHAGNVVDSEHKNHLLSINCDKGTQTLYLRIYVTRECQIFTSCDIVGRELL
jgi:hypothetical protein